MEAHVAIALAVLALLVATLKRSRRRLTLSQIAALAFDHGEQLGATPGEKLRIAQQAAERLDEHPKSQKRDAARRIAIEAEVKRRSK